ncbi:MAG: hypothetical protein GY697_09400, partial [Desulfobacterales bacterium]|nr:hypothetical protein [Desulfobacterales bacterium]
MIGKVIEARLKPGVIGALIRRIMRLQVNTGRQINAKTPHLQVAGNTCKLSLYTLAAICILAWVAGCG